jgi:hypothetical protein
MTDRFDPNIPPGGPTDPAIEGEFTGIVAITEQPTLGKSNLVVNRDQSFDIEVSWHVFGNLVPLWLTALSVSSPDRVVTAYAESQGPGDEITQRGKPRRPDPVGHLQDRRDHVPRLGPRAGGLRHDGYAEGPIIKVESPL